MDQINQGVFHGCDHTIHHLFLHKFLSSLLIQGSPLRLKGEDGGDEPKYTEDPFIEVHETDGNSREPEVQRIDDKLSLGRRLDAVVKLLNAVNLAWD